MLDRVIHEEVKATLTWLKTKDAGLEPLLEKAYGYAVFPAMGRSGAVVGGATGGGEVIEQGKPVGLAKLSQLTVGVQVGGQTFSELVLFENKNALDAFKKSPITFTANASAVLVKAAATGTSGTSRRAYSRGGMLLELSLGGQKFRFQEHEFEFLRGGKEEQEQKERQGSQGERTAGNGQQASPPNDPPAASASRTEGAGQTHDRQPHDEGGSDLPLDPDVRAQGPSNEGREAPAQPAMGEVTGDPSRGEGRTGGSLASKARKAVGEASSRAAHFLEAHGGPARRLERVTGLLTATHGRPMEKLTSALAGVGKEQTIAPVLRAEGKAALGRMIEKRPGLREALDKAHGYAVFPSVARASAVVGGAYGRGAVFEGGKLLGYAAIVQMTLGVQLGGESFDELILFENPGALDRFKSGKIAFTANASVAILSVGAATSSSYASGTRVVLHSQGGLILETAIGGQKFVFRRKVLG
jgi:lipid-binding SYLF domain-containing protein